MDSSVTESESADVGSPSVHGLDTLTCYCHVVLAVLFVESRGSTSAVSQLNKVAPSMVTSATEAASASAVPRAKPKPQKKKDIHGECTSAFAGFC